MRWMVIPLTRIGLPVAGTPLISPTWVPVPVQRTTTYNARADLAKRITGKDWVSRRHFAPGRCARRRSSAVAVVPVLWYC
jgi:hypothetical protein